MSHETHLKTRNFTPQHQVASDVAAIGNKRHQPVIKHHLSFLRYENLISPAAENYVPPTPDQILSAAEWAGCASGKTAGKNSLAQVASIEEFAMRKWTTTNRPLEDVPTIPGPVWRYFLIRIGIIEQPTYRRAEPSTVVNQSYHPEKAKYPLTLRAKIWYERDTLTIDFFDDSLKSKSRKDGNPIFSATLTHDVSLENGNTIDCLLRHDEFETEKCMAFEAPLYKAFEKLRVKKEQVDYYRSFMKKDVWPTLWRIHDFHCISPRDFLMNKKGNVFNSDPFTTSEDDLPTHRELLALCGWAGIKRSDLAHIAGEKPSRMSYLLSGQGESKYKEARELFDKGQINSNKLAGIRWSNTISRHAWALILAAFGLAPQIPVIGRSEPRARKVRTFTEKEVNNVPVEFTKITTAFSFTNPMLTKIKVIGQTSNQLKQGPEWSKEFTVSKNIDGIISVDGAPIGRNTEAPESWFELTQHAPEFTHTYITKGLWSQLGHFLKFYHTS